MLEPERRPVADGVAQDPALPDPALLMRRAIRAVAAAEATVAKTRADAAHREVDLQQRQATSSTRAYGRTNDHQADVDRRRAEIQGEVEGVLHIAVEQYIGLLRDAGKAPERALVQLKGVLRDTPTEDLDRADRAHLMERVVRWGIEAYYRVPQAADARARPSDVETLVRDCLTTLTESGPHALLARLNARTGYRFTAIYRIEGPLLRNVALFDRENPARRVGSDIDRLADTCCEIATETWRPFPTGDACADPRLGTRHAGLSSVQPYQGAPIFTLNRRVWGTLCHFDLRARLMSHAEVEVLAWVASALPVEALVP